MTVFLRIATLDAARAAEVAREVAVQRTFGVRKRKRRRLPRQIYPSAIERDFARQIRAVVRPAREALTPFLAELGPLLAAAARELRSTDGAFDAGEAKRIRQLTETARAKVEELVRPREAEAVARRIAENTSRYQRKQIARQAQASLGVDILTRDRKLPGIIDGFAAENVALITSIPYRFADEMERMVTRAATSGTRVEELAENINQRWGVNENHATLIARDQLGKIYGQINHARQQELGVRRFIWRTVNDERVRDGTEGPQDHARLEGTEHDYDDPPDTGTGPALPGEDIQCRCYAEPIFGDVLAELEALEALPDPNQTEE